MSHDYPHIHEGFLGNSNDAIPINYSNCILYVTYCIHSENLNNQNKLTIDFLGVPVPFQICINNRKKASALIKQIAEFEKFSNIYDNL